MAVAFAVQYFWYLSLNFPQVGYGNEGAGMVQTADPTQSARECFIFLIFYKVSKAS